MALEREPSSEKQIDDDAVKRYFDGAGGTAPAAMSVMSHEHNLPSSAVEYRLSKELGTIGPWLDTVAQSGRVLDVGCGAGAWVEIFAHRYRSAVGVERSPLMVEAAKERVAHLSNAEVYQGDGRQDLPDGPFELIFLGGLMMYQGDTDVVELLHSLKSRLSDGGTIILRESTVRRGALALKGDYQVVYRSVDVYQKLFEEAGIQNVEVRRNFGYTCLVIAEELIDLRRKWLPFLPKDSLLLGSVTWSALRAATPISFWALPQALSRLNVPWPKLQNHFFRLQPLD
ncbi:MAG: class I SAM-dependent methyltransferase [Chloroflexi bacterium]|nr:class I SAM-dependent methyltransferase [Chloroflexota bacterium]